MRRFAGSRTYARARLANAVIFMILGALVGIRAFATVGPSPAALPAYVLAAAMVALGAYRLRTYLALRSQR